MIKYALYSYIPRRQWQKVSFMEQDICRKIIGFKDGRNVYSRWAAQQIAQVLAGNDMADVTIVCVPASTQSAHTRRWKRFSHLLCQLTGARDGFNRVQVIGCRKRAHVTGEYELATNIKHCLNFDDDFFYGRKVLVIDDIYTTGRSSRSFIGALQARGANVVGALFLAKTNTKHPR